MSKKYTIHAGHNPAGKIACGASDFLDESTEARWIVRQLIKLDKGKNLVNCTVNSGNSQSDVLRKIVAKCNDSVGDNVSIHFNACYHSKSDGKNKGCEVWLYSKDSVLHDEANKILKNMEKLGFRNRGIKYSKELYFLRKTKKPSMLIEVCFVDDEDDARLYKKKRADVVKAIYEGLFK